MLILLILVIITIIFFVPGLAHYITGIDPTITVGFITAFATITVAVISVIISRYMERLKIIEEQHRSYKLPLYNKLISYMYGLIRSSYGRPAEIETKPEFIHDIIQDLLIWGSPEVLKNFSEFMQIVLKHEEVEKPEVRSVNIMVVLEKVFYAIRKDLGHNDRQLKQGDLLNLFTKDAKGQVNSHY